MQQVKMPLKTLTELYPLWDKLGNVPVTEDGQHLDEPFLHFGKGAETESVWHWFEAQNPRFIVGDVMQGIRHADEVSGKLPQSTDGDVYFDVRAFRTASDFTTGRTVGGIEGAFDIESAKKEAGSKAFDDNYDVVIVAVGDDHPEYAPGDVVYRRFGRSAVEPGKLAQKPIDGTEPTSGQRRKPSNSTLQALLVAKRVSDLDTLTAHLQKKTTEAYAKYGVGAEQYEQPFDDLHFCRIVRMAMKFRAERGLPPDAHTPYDDADLAAWLDAARKQPVIERVNRDHEANQATAREMTELDRKMPERDLVVDGMVESGAFAGDGGNALFVVFDADRQENIAGPLSTRDAGETARLAILSGAAPVLDSTALSAIIQAHDDGKLPGIKNPLSAAFEVTEEDVENVLHQHSGRIQNRDGKSIKEVASAVFAKLDRDAVARAAIDGGDDLESQGDAAYVEITYQLADRGVLDGPKREMQENVKTSDESENAEAGKHATTCTRAELVGRLTAGEKGEDIPVLMEEFGCDYEKSCELVFSGRHAEASDLLELSWPKITTKEQYMAAGREWEAATWYCDTGGDPADIQCASRRCTAVERALVACPFECDEDGVVTDKLIPSAHRPESPSPRM